VSLARRLVTPPGEDFGVAQATILEFDPLTLANRVEYDGLVIDNAPVKVSMAALAFQPGDVVMLYQWFPGGKRGERGIGSMWIEPPIVTPGEDAVEKIVAAMRSQVGRAIAAEVFADRIHFESADAGQSTTSGSYTTLTGGPVIEDVEVSEAGLLLVGVQSHIFVTNTEAAGRLGHMSYTVSGATDRTALDANNYTVGATHTNLSNVNRVDVKGMAWSAQSGLNPGVHAVTAQYRVSISDSNAITFQHRRLMVMAF
jgi:hypothetical protein